MKYHALEALAQRKHADVLPNLRMTGTQANSRGDETSPTMTRNPYMAQPAAATEYENGWEYAQALAGGLLQATSSDVQRWLQHSVAWREGFAAAAKAGGADRIGQLVRSKTAEEQGWGPVAVPLGAAVLGGAAGTGLGVLANQPLGLTDGFSSYLLPALGSAIGSNLAGHAAASLYDPERRQELRDPSNLPLIAAGGRPSST